MKVVKLVFEMQTQRLASHVYHYRENLIRMELRPVTIDL